MTPKTTILTAFIGAALGLTGSIEAQAQYMGGYSMPAPFFGPPLNIGAPGYGAPGTWGIVPGMHGAMGMQGRGSWTYVPNPQGIPGTADRPPAIQPGMGPGQWTFLPSGMSGMGGMQGTQANESSNLTQKLANTPGWVCARWVYNPAAAGAMTDMSGMSGMQGMTGMDGMSGMQGMTGTGGMSGMTGMDGMGGMHGGEAEAEVETWGPPAGEKAEAK